MNKIKPLRLESAVKYSEKERLKLVCVKVKVETFSQKSCVLGIELDVKLESQTAFWTHFIKFSSFRIQFIQFCEVINEIIIVAELEIAEQTAVFAIYAHY